MMFSAKQKLGSLLFDLPQYARAMWMQGGINRQSPWIFVRNRHESLSSSPTRIGVRCEWKYTSDLHISKVFPQLGNRLLRRALTDWPIELNADPAPNNAPVVSFILGHRGKARLPHLITTLRSIAGQVGTAFECIVVEQSHEPEIKESLPNWVQYKHTPLPRVDMPYSRSWAFNVGAELARGHLLIFHDNDMLVPKNYSAQILARHNEGYDVVNIKRFVFYLNQEDSAKVMRSGDPPLNTPPEIIVQNLEAGGSFAITRDAFLAIGGFDESFVGWGGEDNEFWERAQTRSVWPYGYMPLVHLWHEPQPEKVLAEQAPAKERYWKLSEIPADARIEMLLAAGKNPSAINERKNGNY